MSTYVYLMHKMYGQVCHLHPTWITFFTLLLGLLKQTNFGLNFNIQIQEEFV